MEESMETDDGDDRHLLSVDSIKVIAESIGISALDEEVCKRLTEDLEFRLKEVYIYSMMVTSSLYILYIDLPCAHYARDVTIIQYIVYSMLIGPI